MSSRFFISLIILSLFGNNILLPDNAHLRIVKWTPTAQGNFQGILPKPTPTFVWASFDGPVTDAYYTAYIKFLESYFMKLSTPLTQLLTSKYQDEILIRVPGTTSRDEVEAIFNNANRHFDPGFKTPQEIAAAVAEERLKREALARKAAEEDAKKKFEGDKLKIEAEKRVAEERKIFAEKEMAKIQRQLEAQLKEKQAREAKEQAELEASEAKYKSYSVVALPKDFFVFGRSQVFNNLGQVAGCIAIAADPLNIRRLREYHSSGDKSCRAFYRSQMHGLPVSFEAALWDMKKGISVLTSGPFAYKSIAYTVNDLGFAAVSRISLPMRTILWNTNTNEVIFGPKGHPYAMNNNNTVLIETDETYFSTTAWLSKNNTIKKNSAPFPAGIHDTDILYYDYWTNSKGNVLHQANYSDLLFDCRGSSFLLLPCEGEIIPDSYSSPAHLNDYDEVVALINIGYMGCAISKWDANKKASRSCALRTIKELKDFSLFVIIGFNNSGQILLEASIGQAIHQSTNFMLPQLFLLTPK